MQIVWTRALADFEKADLEAACGAFLDSGDDWPPGLPRFKAMCAVARQRREADLARNRQGQLALTAHNSSEAQALVAEARANFLKLRPAAVGVGWAEAAVKAHETGERRLTPDALKIAREALARQSVREHQVHRPDPGVSAPAVENLQQAAP